MLRVPHSLIVMSAERPLADRRVACAVFIVSIELILKPPYLHLDLVKNLLPVGELENVHLLLALRHKR